MKIGYIKRPDPEDYDVEDWPCELYTEKQANRRWRYTSDLIRIVYEEVPDDL